MGSHPVLQCGLFIFIHRIGCHGNDRQMAHIRPGHGPDRSGCLIAIHDRHLHIHQDGIIVSLFHLLHHLHRIRAVWSRIHDETGLFQDFLRNLTVEFVILYEQNTLSVKISLQPCGLFLVLFNQSVCHEQYGLKIGHKKRFCTKRADSRFPGILLNI